MVEGGKYLSGVETYDIYIMLNHPIYVVSQEILVDSVLGS